MQSAQLIASEKEIRYEEGLQQSEQTIAEERERADSFRSEALILSTKKRGYHFTTSPLKYFLFFSKNS